MRRLAVVSAAAVGLLAAGCGGGGQDGAAATTATAGGTAAPAATTPSGPDGLEAIVKKCQLSPLRSPTPDDVPAEFKPEHTRVVAVRKDEQGFTATLIYDQSVADAFEELKKTLVAAGYQLRDSENEGRDAELFFERGGKPTEVRLKTARTCDDASQAVVASGGEEGVESPEEEGEG